MVVLSKKDLIRQSIYFGKQQARGSKRKAVDLKGVGIVPLGSSGSGLFTFGQSGAGMTLMGTGFRSAVKSLLGPLLRRGRQEVIRAAQHGVKRIRQPQLRSLAQRGVDIAERGDIERALSENDKLGAISRLGMQEGREAAPELLKLAEMGAKRGLRAVRGRGAPTLDSAAEIVSDRKQKANTQSTTKDNRQLTLLKDVMRSKPIKKRTIRAGGGLTTL